MASLRPLPSFRFSIPPNPATEKYIARGTASAILVSLCTFHSKTHESVYRVFEHEHNTGADLRALTICHW